MAPLLVPNVSGPSTGDIIGAPRFALIGGPTRGGTPFFVLVRPVPAPLPGTFEALMPPLATPVTPGGRRQRAGGGSSLSCGPWGRGNRYLVEGWWIAWVHLHEGDRAPMHGRIPPVRLVAGRGRVSRSSRDWAWPTSTSPMT